MKFLRSRFSFFAIASLSLIGAVCLYNLSLFNTHELALRNKASLQAQALEAAVAGIKRHPSPESWDFGIFFGAKSFEAALNSLAGSELIYQPRDNALAGTRVKLESISCTPELASSDVRLVLTAEQNDKRVTLEGDGLIEFLRYEQVADDKVIARFAVLPTRLHPTITIGGLLFGLGSFWDQLVPELATIFAEPNTLTVGIPVPKQFKARVGSERQVTSLITGTGARLSYNEVPPTIELQSELAYGPPLMVPDGIWLLASLTPEERTAQPGPALRTTPANDADLDAIIRDRTADLKAHVASFQSDPNSARIFVGRAVFQKLGDSLRSLSPEQRRYSLREFQITGHLIDKAWGAGFGVYAEMQGSGNAEIRLADDLAFTFGPDGQATLAGSVRATAQAPLKLHIYAPVGGGVGTVVGMVGEATGVFHATLATRVLKNDGIQVLALDLVPDPTLLQVELTTDGHLKTQSVDMSMPKIGVKAGIPIFTAPNVPIALLDSRPRLIPMKMAKLGKNGTWAYVPKYSALKVAIQLESSVQNGRGISVSAHPVIVPLAQSAQENEVEIKNYSEAVANLLATNAISRDFSFDTKWAAILGDLEIGPNSFVVELFVEAGQLTKDFLQIKDRVTAQLNLETFKGWLEDPAGSWKRGDVHKAFGMVADWINNPVDSYERGDVKKVVDKVVAPVVTAPIKLFRHLFHW